MAGGNRLADGAEPTATDLCEPRRGPGQLRLQAPLSVARADALHAYVRHGFVAGENGAVHLACRPVDEARIFRGGGDHPTFDRLGEVGCPVQVACGADTPGPATFAPDIVAALPDGRLERHPHLGHFGPLEAPSELAGAIRAFAATI